MVIKYINKDTTSLYNKGTGYKKKMKLLWGDRVEILEEGAPRTKVRARGKTGYVKNDDLGGTSLLEFYFIDVGQGDGILIRTPDHRHILIDGGWPRHKQPLGKNAADFVDWKFYKDYGNEQIHLDAVICSHNDQDHYGGLWDLMDREERDGLDCQDVRVEHFYHAGLAWWEGEDERELGPSEDTPDGKMFTRLMGDRAAVIEALKPDANPKLQGDWSKFLRVVTETKCLDDSSTPISRLSDRTEYLPGFEPGQNGPSIKILAPVEFEVNGEPALRRFKSDPSENTNGNSILLRVDYQNTRFLLTGDLNKNSQSMLLKDYEGHHEEFACDVAKACHHGSEDISYAFLEKMEPSATIISSGDNEGHDHPRPSIIAASALTGRKQVVKDQLKTPLVYSTELARSVSFGTPTQVEVFDDNGNVTDSPPLDQVKITYEEIKVGDLHPITTEKWLRSRKIVAGLVYGLVNVRTDGHKILCATLNEKEMTWQIKTFNASE